MHSMNLKSGEDENFGGTDGTNCEDKISSLHDDLLIHILMFLPTKDVVATMCLSKRWKCIWKMVPRLEYEERNTNNQGDSVSLFLEKTLQQHKAPILESLSIELDKRCPIDADVSKWITRAVDREVRMLTLKIKWYPKPIAIPTNLYTCETLVELNLNKKIIIDIPSSVCLTSLKKLCLKEVLYKDEVSAIRLLSRCPVLEELSVHRYRKDNMTNFIV